VHVAKFRTCSADIVRDTVVECKVIGIVVRIDVGTIESDGVWRKRVDKKSGYVVKVAKLGGTTSAVSCDSLPLKRKARIRLLSPPPFN
jgi:hypothetical protein